METSPPLLPPLRPDRRNAITFKLIFIAGLVLLLQVPLHLINSLRQERMTYWGVVSPSDGRALAAAATPAPAAATAFDAYRMVERAVKHGVLVHALVFAAYFLFEILAGLRLHAVHYGLVGAALCLFYLALLALGEVVAPGTAYVAAAVASSLLVVCYSAAILRQWIRAGLVAALLAVVHGVLFVVLRMEDFALLAGTGALFAALAAVMFFTRNIDWSGPAAAPAGGVR